MIGEIPDGPNVRYLIIAWDTESNFIDYDAPGMSCFDVPGVLGVAAALADARIPTMETEPESEES